MSDAITSSYSQLGTNAQRNLGSARSLVHLDAAPQRATQGDSNMAPLLPGAEETPFVHNPLVHDKGVAEVAIRRLSKEMEHAKEELRELEGTFLDDLFIPSVRGWLLPLMAVGLVLSLYGSIASSSSAEFVATGMMLLWSLSAFWYIYTRERRREMAKEANRAEIEIWSGRIEELQRSLELHQHIVDAARDPQPSYAINDQ